MMVSDRLSSAELRCPLALPSGALRNVSCLVCGLIMNASFLHMLKQLVGNGAKEEDARKRAAALIGDMLVGLIEYSVLV